MRRTPRVVLLSLAVVAAAAAIAGCGSSSTTTTTTPTGSVQVNCQIAFAKTKFILHTGIALGAFHRYVYKPYRAGAFKKGAPGRKKALLKAGASALLAYHELKVADQDAKCDGPALKKLASPLAQALAALSSLKSAIGTGNLAGIGSAGALLDSLVAKAAQNGVHLKDVKG
jgi:hypothetical protein